jgi:hypothetical protein
VVPRNEEGESGRDVLSGVAYRAGDVWVLAGGADGTGIGFSVALHGGMGGGAFWVCAGDPVSRKGSRA